MHTYQKRPTVTVATSIAATLCCFLANVAPASADAGAAADAPASEVNEVVVTARRREESLQEVPAAVSFISGDQLEVAGVRRVTDLTAMVPNLSINSGYRQGSLWISMRGIASVQGGEPPVAVLIDGVQVASQDFINEELGDIRSVQVLRGPQGAIYGRGAIGGAILIDTELPKDKLTADATLDFGNHHDFRQLVSVAGPLYSDVVLGRLTVLSRSTQGFQPNLTTGENADSGHGLNVSGRLLFNLPDDWTVDLNARRQAGRDGASYEYLVNDVTRYDYDNHTAGDVNDPNVVDDHTIDAVSAKIDKKIGGVTITSITQYADAISRLFGDADFTATHLLLQANRVSSSATNQDLRIASNDDGPFQWLLGGFLQDRTNINKLVETADPLGDLDPSVLYANSDQYEKSFAWAGYGQASLKLPMGFEVSGAARYDTDRRTSYDALDPATRVHATFSKFQPQGTIKKDITQDMSAYATVGRGFRSGGFNPYADTVTLGVDREYSPETSTNYEVGMKTRWLDGALTANAALFYTDYRNQQFFFISVTPIARDIYTIDKTTIKGAELELNYTVAKELAISASFGSSDSEIKQFRGSDEFNGNQSPNSYKYTANASVQYTPQITADYSGLVYFDWERRGTINFDVQNQYNVGPKDTFNGRLGVTRGAYQMSVYMRNITDERFPVLFQANAAGPGVHGQLLNMPRQFGVELKASF
jgi:iron complex outermembrane receptor protein